MPPAAIFRDRDNSFKKYSAIPTQESSAVGEEAQRVVGRINSLGILDEVIEVKDIYVEFADITDEEIVSINEGSFLLIAEEILKKK